METRISVITNFSPATPAELIDNNANIFPCDTSLGLNKGFLLPFLCIFRTGRGEERRKEDDQRRVEGGGGEDKRTVPMFPYKYVYSQYPLTYSADIRGGRFPRFRSKSFDVTSSRKYLICMRLRLTRRYEPPILLPS